MSEKNRTPSQKNYKRATISIFTSTPTDHVPQFHHSTSLSRIDTASSSSTERLKDISFLQRTRKATKRLKSSLKDEKKSKIANKVHYMQQETSSEWETELEESVDEAFTHLDDSSPKKSNNTSIELFKDLHSGSPEKIRDAPTEFESPVALSPILGSSRVPLISKRTTEQREKLVPINIPSLDVSKENLQDTDEDEIILCRTQKSNTYPAHRRLRFAKNCLLDMRNFLYPTEYFTATSDLLWEKFVEENRAEVSQYLAPSSAREPAKQYESEFLKKYPDIPPKFEDIRVPGMKCTRKHFDRILDKWVTESSESENNEDDVRQPRTKKNKKNVRQSRRKKNKKGIKTGNTDKDIYNPLNEKTDIEFETGGQNGKQMTLAEFRQKRKRMMNTAFDNISSAPCHLRMQ
ncbi:uncharacterized protein LOC114941677 [Nylanderia fulva]|uniref:uncharacterized protein LOC114941677 n=1 Tax=Nylanderia fulva TaxID=613905 RepID=UPI0010FADF4A|nr:uncharacterized protein LOC114941677 [Nylanderia fulva]